MNNQLVRSNQGGKGYGTVIPKANPLDMIRITPLRYMVMNNPQGVHDFLYSKGVNVGNNVASVLETSKRFAQLGGDAAMMEMIKAVDTPYKQMVLSAYNKDSNFDGKEAEPQNNPAPVSVAKEEGTFGGIKLDAKTIIIAMAIIIFFLLIIRKG